MYRDLAASGKEKHSRCQGKGKRRALEEGGKKNYLQLNERRKANFNQLFELVARISRECDLKEDWQLLYWNTHNGKVFQHRGKIGDVL